MMLNWTPELKTISDALYCYNEGHLDVGYTLDNNATSMLSFKE